MSYPVVIVEYNPRWPELYGREELCILKVLGGEVLAIEHIGSTAVPGLGGKPIIDIMLGVSDSDEAALCLEPLRKLGYVDVTPQPGNPEWYYCLAKGPHTDPHLDTTYHLHLVKFKSDHWRRHLLFREFLRIHPEVAREYYELKRELAGRYGSDRRAYTEGKTAFIEAIVARARGEGQSAHNG